MSVVEVDLKLLTALFMAEIWVLRSKLLYLSEGNKGKIEFFTSKAFLNIL